MLGKADKTFLLNYKKNPTPTQQNCQIQYFVFHFFSW